MKSILKRTRLEHMVVYLVLLVLLILTVSVVIEAKRDADLRNTPVDVLKDWTLTVDGSRVYRPGDEIPVVSTFNKLVDIAPKKSQRFVQCIRAESREDALAKFDSGTTAFEDKHWGNKAAAPEGASSVNAGKSTVTVNVVIPFTLGSLPSICRVNINPTYDVNKYYPDFPENAFSNPFKVEPRPGVSVVDSTTTYVYTDESTPNSGQAMISILPQAGERVIIYQNPPTSKLEEDSRSTPRPGLFESITRPVTNFVERIL